MRAGARQSPGWLVASGRLVELIRGFPLPPDSLRFALPPISQDALRRALGLPVDSPALESALESLAELDRRCPGWAEAAPRLLIGDSRCPQTVSRAASVMLSLRPATSPGPLVKRLADMPAGDDRASACLLALMLTDTAETVALQRPLLERWCAPGNGAKASESAIFLSFLKCLQHETLDEPLAERALRCGAMGPHHDNGRRARAPFFHPVLDYLGLTRCDYFRRMYERAIESLVFEPSVGGWETIRWVRRFCGERYLVAAAERLDDEPSDPGALHIARWAHDFAAGRRELGLRIAALKPRTLMLLSVIRRDLDSTVAAALTEPGHALAMRLLHQGPFRVYEAALRDDRFRNWCVKWGRVLEAALAVFSASRRMRAPVPRMSPLEWARREIAPHLPRLLDNLAFVWAAGGTSWDLLSQRVAVGSLAAVLSLGLVEEHLEEAASILVQILDGGTMPQRQAAERAMAEVCRRLGVSVEKLRAGLEADAAWRDAGLEGTMSRAWPDVAGWTVKLTIARGKPEITAYGPRGPAKRLPPEVRRHAKFDQIARAKTELAQHQARLRDLLEQAMNSQRVFSADEFAALCSSAMFRDMASRLVLEAGSNQAVGSEMVERISEPVRVAHAARLLREDRLAAWQERIVHERIAQPFKQCFREVYLCEPEEKGWRQCLRFDGVRVFARRAFALLRARGWAPCDGCATKDWPAQGTRARFVWAQGIESVGPYLVGRHQREPVSLGALWFAPLGSDGEQSDEPLTLGEVDPVAFSESLRDADLIAAKAGSGDVGLSSRETLALRAGIVRLLARELGLWQVSVGGDDHYALVRSGEEDFRVHLGTGSVFTEPEGRHVPVLAGVRARGKELTLPFEAPDMETARIVATIVGLARSPQSPGRGT